VELLIFVFIFNDCSKCRKNYGTILHKTHFPLNAQKMADLHGKSVSPTHLISVSGFYFLDVPCVCQHSHLKICL
jgi:hypothetical protein